MRLNLVSLLITALWLVMMSLLVRDHLLPQRIGEDAVEMPIQRLSDRWRDLREFMVIRRGETILGATALTLERDPDGMGHTVSQRLVLDLGLGGRVDLTGVAALGPEMELDRFWARLEAPAIDVTVRGQAVDESLVFEIETPQGRRLFRQPIEGSFSLLDAVRPSLLENIELEPGTSYRIRSADLFGSLAVSDFVIEVQDYDIIETLGGEVATYRIATEFGGFRTVVWVDEMGRVVLQRVWGDIVLERLMGARTREILADYPDIFEPAVLPDFDLTDAPEAESWSDADQSLFSLSRILWEAAR